MDAPENRKPMYPVFLDIAGESCLVVGGGRVAERKVEKLLESGARVTVVAPEVTEQITSLAADKKIGLELRAYAGGEAAEYFLTVAATDDPALNRAVSGDARAARRLVNVVDVPELCNFYVPSVLRRGDLQVAVSTAGASPSLAKKIRERLEEQFPDNYARLLETLRAFRARLLEKVPDESKRMEIYAEIARSPEIDMFLEGDPAPLAALIEKCV